MAGRDQRTEIDRTEQVVFRQDELRGDQVLAHRPDVLPWCDGRQDLQAVITEILDLLGHDDRVGVGRQRIAGIDPCGVLTDPQLHRRTLAGPEGLFGTDGDAVHGRGVVVRHADSGEDRLGRDATQRVDNWHMFTL
jgi:hypothetical protein